MGYKKICLNGKKDIINFVNSFSDNIMIKNLIYDLINRDGVTNFFYDEDDGSYSISLTTHKYERVYILFSGNIIYILNNLDGIRQQVIYKNDGEISIKNRINSKISSSCYDEVRTIECYTKFDECGKLICNQKKTSSFLNCDDEDMNDKIREMMYENYEVISNEFLVGDKLLKVQSINYLYNSDINKVEYFMCDYFEGVFGSENSSKYILPRYNQISEEEFNSLSFGTMGVQKVKKV